MYYYVNVRSRIIIKWVHFWTMPTLSNNSAAWVSGVAAVVSVLFSGLSYCSEKKANEAVRLIQHDAAVRSRYKLTLSAEWTLTMTAGHGALAPDEVSIIPYFVGNDGRPVKISEAYGNASSYSQPPIAPSSSEFTKLVFVNLKKELCDRNPGRCIEERIDQLKIKYKIGKTWLSNSVGSPEQ